MSNNFDLSSYETVKQRKSRFYEDHADGRILVELVNPQTIMEYALFKASILVNETTVSTGYAMELRDKELSRTSSGKTYESVNYSSWTENAEESAVGRALDNFGYSSNGKCSKEEMIKAYKNTQVLKKEEKREQFKIQSPGEFKFGKGKYEGKKIKDINAEELSSYADWLHNTDKDKFKELIANIDAYIDSLPKISKNDPQKEFGGL